MPVPYFQNPGDFRLGLGCVRLGSFSLDGTLSEGANIRRLLSSTHDAHPGHLEVEWSFTWYYIRGHHSSNSIDHVTLFHLYPRKSRPIPQRVVRFVAHSLCFSGSSIRGRRDQMCRIGSGASACRGRGGSGNHPYWRLSGGVWRKNYRAGCPNRSGLRAL